MIPYLCAAYVPLDLAITYKCEQIDGRHKVPCADALLTLNSPDGLHQLEECETSMNKKGG